MADHTTPAIAADADENGPTDPENQARVVALLDLVLARADSTDPEQSDAGFRKFARRLVRQSRELLSNTHFDIAHNSFVPDLEPTEKD